MGRCGECYARDLLPVKWEDRMLEYVRERNVRGLEHERIECKDRVNGGSSAMVIPRGKFSGTGVR